MRTKGWVGLLVLAMAVTLVGVACGGKGTTSPGGGGGGSSSSSAAGGHGYGYGGSGGKSSGTTSGGGKGALTLQQTTSLTFVPTTFSVKSGSTITVKNVTTSIPHNFTVKGQKIDITNNPGQSKSVQISLSPGTYQFFCKFHVSQGMKGTLTVT